MVSDVIMGGRNRGGIGALGAVGLMSMSAMTMARSVSGGMGGAAAVEGSVAADQIKQRMSVLSDYATNELVSPCSGGEFRGDR